MCIKKTKLCSHLVTKQSFRHNQNYSSNQKTYFTKVVTFDIQIKCNKRTKLCSRLVTKQSFHHKINYKSNQKTSLTKVVLFYIRISNMQ